jgi:hypothetical protein
LLSVWPRGHQATGGAGTGRPKDADSFPHLRTMDRDLSIDLEAQSYRSAVDFEHRDLEQALEASGAAHDD